MVPLCVTADNNKEENKRMVYSNLETESVDGRSKRMNLLPVIWWAISVVAVMAGTALVVSHVR